VETEAEAEAEVETEAEVEAEAEALEVVRSHARILATPTNQGHLSPTYHLRLVASV